LVLSMSGSQLLAAAGLSDANNYSWQGASVGAAVAINSLGDVMISAPTWRNSADDHVGAVMLFEKDSGADTWTYKAQATGATNLESSGDISPRYGNKDIFPPGFIGMMMTDTHAYANFSVTLDNAPDHYGRGNANNEKPFSSSPYGITTMAVFKDS